MVVPSSPVALVGLFLVGVVLVIWCVEIFIEAVAQSAVSLGVSGFFLAVVLAGVDLENAVLGITAAFVELPGLALGTVFGESLFVLAVAVGLAGILVPFRMDVPRAYLAMLVLVPVPAFALSIGGTIDPLEGAALLGLFVPLLAYIFWHERRSETTYLLSAELQEVIDLEAEPGEGESAETPDGGDELGGRRDREGDLDLDLDLDEFVPSFEHRSGLFNLGIAVLAVVGMTVGSGITVVSAEGIFVAFGISGLAFGATVLSFIASIEELALTVEPVRRNRPELAIGNVVGSTVFYMTANVGIIALLHPISTGGDVLTVHWPFLAACVLVVTVMLTRGRVTRVGGVVLIGLYLVYWVANYL
ncbi:sodium:calcium antiporter [Natrinema zhouii]|uniref:Sodium:calcium antiporter n=1 Tax=Natrinema zhouii TaxID=1710539 RepID=A0A7D6GKV1_9EURY|nr:sodium:calcium antiporter [Natrinema zhouii]QLK26540.1 sodium:calcium antiporter [Natrinema zhouii]